VESGIIDKTMYIFVEGFGMYTCKIRDSIGKIGESRGTIYG